MPVLKPPQNKMPEIKPTDSNVSSEYLTLGRLSALQVRFKSHEIKIHKTTQNYTKLKIYLYLLSKNLHSGVKATFSTLKKPFKY